MLRRLEPDEARWRIYDTIPETETEKAQPDPPLPDHIIIPESVWRRFVEPQSDTDIDVDAEVEDGLVSEPEKTKDHPTER